MEEFGNTESALQFMIKNQTLELPRNFLLRKVKKSPQFSTLRYKGFDVRDKFPNNIVRLREGQIMYVTEIQTTGGTAGAAEEHILKGHVFEKVH